MDYSEAHKVRFNTHILVGEDDDLWVSTRQRMDGEGEEITWVVFNREFLRKYFPDDI